MLSEERGDFNMITDYKPKPKKYNKFKRFIVKKVLINKRIIENYLSKNKIAKNFSKLLQHKVFEHKSLLIRKLKDVEMYLQKNKVTNLKLTAEKISGIVINPGETFSFWNLVGKTTAKKGYLTEKLARTLVAVCVR